VLVGELRRLLRPERLGVVLKRRNVRRGDVQPRLR
jgi:hypothetical protein